jgi:hypothetical protein
MSPRNIDILEEKKIPTNPASLPLTFTPPIHAHKNKQTNTHTHTHTHTQQFVFGDGAPARPGSLGFRPQRVHSDLPAPPWTGRMPFFMHKGVGKKSAVFQTDGNDCQHWHQRADLQPVGGA